MCKYAIEMALFLRYVEFCLNAMNTLNALYNLTEYIEDISYSVFLSHRIFT